MARKPAPGLPDVFASPGAAPSRGAAIEDLPDQPAGVLDRPEPGPSPPPASAHLVPQPIIPAAAAIQPPPPARQLRQHAFAIAVVALVISLSAPVWEGPVLGILGLHNATEQTAQQ